jgi:hypothetical protein
MEETAERQRRRSNLLVAALGFVAVVMLWRAIWDITAELMSPFWSLIIGLVLVAGIAFIERDFIYKLF